MNNNNAGTTGINWDSPKQSRQMVTLLVNDLAVATSNRQINHRAYYGWPLWVFDTDDFILFKTLPSSHTFCDIIDLDFSLSFLSFPSQSSHSMFTTSVCCFPGSCPSIWLFYLDSFSPWLSPDLQTTYPTAYWTPPLRCPRHHKLSVFKTELIVLLHSEFAPPTSVS